MNWRVDTLQWSGIVRALRNDDVVSPIIYVLQSVDDDVPLPSLLDVSLCSILQENLVTLLDIDRLVRHFLAQHRDIFTLDRLFQQFRKILHSSLEVTDNLE